MSKKRIRLAKTGKWIYNITVKYGDKMENIYESIRDDQQEITYMENPNDIFSHFHESVEINYALGDVAVQNNEKTLILHEGQFAFHAPYDIHSNKNGKIIALVLPKKHISDFLSYTKFVSLKDKFFTDDDGEILTLLKKFKNLANYNELEIKGLINLLIGRIIRKTTLVATENDKDSSLIYRIVKYINNNYADKITLDLLSEELNYSKSHISHTIGTYLSCNLNAYLNKVRLTNFVEKTKNNPEKIITNALDVGFDSLQTFYRNFKKFYGVSPYKYFKN